MRLSRTLALGEAALEDALRPLLLIRDGACPKLFSMARKSRLPLTDVLSHLSYAQARRHLGPRGQALLRTGGASAIDIDAQVRMDRHSFTLELDEAVATLRLDDAANDRIQFSCTACATPCEHVGAALSLILEEKLSLGLAAAPRESIHLEMLSESELVERALAALDPSAEKTEVALTGNMDELKRKLQVLVGLKPPAPVDESEKLRVESEAARLQRRERVAMAGGELLTAAFSFVRQAMEGGGAAEPETSTQALKSVLSECMERTEDGGWKMTVRFRDDSGIEALADVLARIRSRSPGLVKVQ